MYKYLIFILAAIVFRLTKQHYNEFPPNACDLARNCNHTGISLCGLEKNTLQRRLFLDECDMHEYNCDYKKEYQVYISECEEQPSTTQLTTFFAEKMTNRDKIVTTTILTSTLTETSTPGHETTTVFQESTTSIEKTTKLVYTTPTITETMPTTKEYSSFLPTEATFTTEVIVTKTISSTKDVEVTTPTTTTKDVEVTTPTTTEYTNLPVTIITTVEENSIETTTSKPTTIKKVPDTTPTMTYTSTSKLSTLNINTNTISETTISVVDKETEQFITKSSKLTERPCESYPSDCFRPLTWITTVKGERRDFFQVLRDLYKSQETRKEYSSTYRRNQMSQRFNGNSDTLRYGMHIDTLYDK